MAAEHDEADHQETGALHQEPGGQPGLAGWEDDSSGGEHGHSGDEDEDEDDDDGKAGGGDRGALLILALLPGDQPGDLLQSNGGLALVESHLNGLGTGDVVRGKKTNQNMEAAADIRLHTRSVWRNLIK